MFEKADDPGFVSGEHQILKLWRDRNVFRRLKDRNAGKPVWSFLDGPITANNPMGVHHAWGRTYKDAFQRYFAMLGRDQRFQNGFDCQGLWVEVEVEKELKLGTKKAIEEYGIDRFVRECKKRVLTFAARQTEQSIRLGYWMEWDDPDELRKLAAGVRENKPVSYTTARGQKVSEPAEEIVAKLGNADWGGSYFTFSTENNETIWTFLKKCFQRGKVYQGHDVMPWSGRGGSAYSQMEVADGRKLTVHRSCFVKFPIIDKGSGVRNQESGNANLAGSLASRDSSIDPAGEFLLVWTTTPWTLTSNVAAAVNPDLTYVRVKSKKDGAIYYFAKDNLDSKRMEREFKEGFGRPEWSWPEGVPKLKSLSQLFKELGGFEVEAELKGAEMVGWRYRGPFDELAAQKIPGGFPIPPGKIPVDAPTGVSCHRVIDGGRDSRGNANVTAGEGTGIVHIAPGCGDVDHKIGQELGLVSIAPLKEDGTFDEGFGPFTGRNSIDPGTPSLVFESLKEKGLLFYVEQYPHIYPFCWRTGDELVFRLVDEWFINMDWRDEIKDVTKSIEWLPASLQGQERELEWLTTMRDWMISKKRFWGLALPIWVNPNDSTDFEVIGSLAELKERAVEGWNGFEGHTPHRPWIDGVKIKSAKTGAVLSRVQDVGNPWLDAGIVPFSTMQYNTNRDAWEKWYPADLVTESFPGQFRNWFYSLLSLATMMRYDEADDAIDKRPFKTLFGYRLVMNEEGQPMHKSDGTAIWFEEAAEQLGVDALRWLYLSQNPAQDLRFGTRHPNDHVTIETPEGPISETKEGVPCCKVTSKPVDEVRRQVLIPLWNSYAFFVNYARLDNFTPDLPKVPVAERPEIDRWLLSNLQSLTATCRAGFEAFDTSIVTKAAAEFIDDLSNWYIRRNRKRFWRSRDEGSGVRNQESGKATAVSRQVLPSTNHPLPTSKWDSDKLAAYQTLYETLVALTKLLAPCIPFLAERMYQNLVVGSGEAKGQTSEANQNSVHLCDYPAPNAALLDESLNHRMATAQRVVTMGHRLREGADRRVRQPLAELKYASSNAQDADDIARLRDVIADELNVKMITRAENLDDLVHYSYKPNLKTLGPKLGKLLNAVKTALPTIDEKTLAPLRRGQPVTVEISGQSVTLAPEDVMVSTEQATEWASADDSGIQIALSTVLTPELIREGMARDLIRQVQQLRKDHDLDENEQIIICWDAGDREELSNVLAEWHDTIQTETRAAKIEERRVADAKAVQIGGGEIALAIERLN